MSVILSKPPFYCLAVWVSVHILKLNFVVATINDQLEYALPQDTVDILIRLFGAILPFGFVVLPGVAYLLARSTITRFQVANIIGVLYGAVLTFLPSSAWYQVLVVFTSVATSRQLVYSTVFHQTGELFGFNNYGVLLGLTNICVSAVSLVQGPLVEWSEQHGSYYAADLLLFLVTIPLFGIVYWTVPQAGLATMSRPTSEQTPLMRHQEKRERSLSDAVRL